MTTLPDVILYASDSRGVYIPQYFAESIVGDCLENVSKEDIDILLKGPYDNEPYWDAWSNVCDHGKVIDTQGNEFFLYQNGDLWLVPVNMVWNEEEEFFEYPQNEEKEND